MIEMKNHMLVVLDTNELVSGLLTGNGKPATILDLVLHGPLTPCCNAEILSEYKNVLNRKKFGFQAADIKALIAWIKSSGVSAIAQPCNDTFVDEDDRKFYEVALACDALLITGNTKHYPKAKRVKSPSAFLSLLEDELDTKDAEVALSEFEKDPTIIPAKEIANKFLKNRPS